MSISPEQTEPHDPDKRDLGLYAMVFLTLMFGVVFLSGPARSMWIKMKMQGEPAPAFSLRTVKGSSLVTLNDYKGKVVLIDFWTTWCPPCRKQMPALQRLHTDPKYKGKLVVLSVNANEPEATLERKVQLYIKHFKLTMPSVYADPSILKAYNVTAFPTLVLINERGQVVHFLRGKHGEAEIRNMVDGALGS